MEKLWIWILLVLVLLIGFSAAAQLPISNSDAVWKVLDDGVQKKLVRADKIMAKALDYTKRADTYEKQIEALRNDKGRIKFGKIRKLERRRNASIVQSRPYYQDAYAMGYKALDKQIGMLSGQAADRNVDVVGLTKKSKDRYKQGNKLYKKSERQSNAQSQIELIVLGNQKMKEALTVQTQTIESLTQTVFASIAEPVVEQVPEQTSVVDSTSALVAEPQLDASVNEATPSVSSPAVSVPAAVTAVAATTAVMAGSDKPTETVQTPPPATPNQPAEIGDVFITIQIMSVKAAATPEQIKQAYNGPQKVMELVSADYYRYAVGKFRSVDEAKAAMAAEGIKGIVVAFKGSERISVAEAVTVLGAAAQ
jgi:hypothetical protein